MYTNHTKSRKAYAGIGLLLLQDGVLSGMASLLSVQLVRWLSDPIPEFTYLVLVWVGTAMAATTLGLLSSGCQKVVCRWTVLKSMWRFIQALFIKETALTLLIVLGAVHMPSAPLSVLAILSDVLFTSSFLFYIRFVARRYSRSEPPEMKALASRRNALVAGTDKESVDLALELSRDYNVMGFLSDDERMCGRVISDFIVYYANGAHEFEMLEWRLGGIDCVFFPNTAAGIHGNGEGAFSGAASMEASAVPDGISSAGQLFKRAFDVTASAILMVVFSPLAAFSALAIWREDGGPVIYRQERVGKGGRTFNILKFRSMRTDAEAFGAQLCSGERDPRLTRVGAFLRAYHLDELPQLWNVFKGDMSFIGYRPERPVFIRQIMEMNPRYRYLYQIRPGVTSYATLYNGYTDTLEKMLTRLDLDLYYLRNHSVLFDARVLFLTFMSIVTGKRF